MPAKSFNEKWCPFGRLSIQRVTNDRGVEVVSGGAYNQALVQTSPRDPGTKMYHSTVCCGNVCAFYRRGLNPWGWGYCSMSPQSTGKYIVIAAILLSMCATALRFWG